MSDTAVVINGHPDALPTRRVPGEFREYRKTASVMAVQMPIGFVVDTLEGRMVASAGDYLCEGPAGEAWPVKQSIFEATYEEVR